MGLDLSFLPIEYEAVDGTWGFSHSMLNCARRRDLFECLLPLPSYAVPPRFATFRSREGGGDSHYGNTQDTPYGEPLTWVPAKVLYDYADHPDVQDNAQNRAVWAYLGQLPPNTKIALFWH